MATHSESTPDHELVALAKSLGVLDENQIARLASIAPKLGESELLDLREKLTAIQDALKKEREANEKALEALENLHRQYLQEKRSANAASENKQRTQEIEAANHLFD